MSFLKMDYSRYPKYLSFTFSFYGKLDGKYHSYLWPLYNCLLHRPYTVNQVSNKLRVWL